MKRSELRRIASDPVEYRRNLVVRGPRGACLFPEIEQDFQRPVLADIDASFTAIREDRLPERTRIWYEATKGCGKDTLAAIEILWLLAFTPRSIQIQVGAGDKDQANELRKAAKQILSLNQWLRQFVEPQHYKIINPTFGSECEIIATDDQGSHGSRPDVVILNELTHQTDDGFANTMMDNAGKVPTNVTIVLTNHGHKDTWQWRWRESARTGGTWAFHSKRGPAPWVNQKFLEERRVQSGELRYRRLWEGDWVIQSESALSEYRILAACRLSAGQRGRELPIERFFGGLDLGVRRDRAAFVTVSRGEVEAVETEEGKVRDDLRLADVQSWKPSAGSPVDLMAVEEAVFEAHRRYTYWVVFYDPSQCELMAQRLIKRGVPMEPVPFTAGSLQEMATAVLEAFNSHEISLFKHGELIEDLKSLKLIERGNSYRVDAERTVDGHADTAFGFLLALLAAKRNPFVWARPFIDRNIVKSEREEPSEDDQEPRQAVYVCPACGLLRPTPVCVECECATRERGIMSLALEEAGISLEDAE